MRVLRGLGLQLVSVCDENKIILNTSYSNVNPAESCCRVSCQDSTLMCGVGLLAQVNTNLLCSTS